MKKKLQTIGKILKVAQTLWSVILGLCPEIMGCTPQSYFFPAKANDV